MTWRGGGVTYGRTLVPAIILRCSPESRRGLLATLLSLVCFRWVVVYVAYMCGRLCLFTQVRCLRLRCVRCGRLCLFTQGRGLCWVHLCAVVCLASGRMNRSFSLSERCALSERRP